MANKNDGARLRICRTGGSVKVTLSSDVGQGNDGTSIVCKGCWVQAATTNTEVVKMNIGIAASANLGVELAKSYEDSNNAATAQPLWVPISDVAQLYFYSSDTDAIVDITYLLG